MPAPLSHHEIATLAEPFVRRGWVPDLARSDRGARRLQFAPRTRQAAARRFTETLVLEAAGPLTLRRDCALDGSALVARLRLPANSADAAARALDAVPATAQWCAGRGFVVAVDVDGARVVQAHAQAEGCALQLGGEGRLRLDTPRARHWPDDLLAVLGRAWSPLASDAAGAWARFRRAGGTLEARSVQAAQHLARTLAAPPAAFHARTRHARWRAWGRRTLPALAGASLLALGFAAPWLRDARDSLWPLAALAVPPLLLALALRGAAPTLTVPPWPRPPAAPAW
jgi:hypothetical protein